MAQDYASSILGVSIRVTRLTPSGAAATGPEASYVTSKFVSLSFTPEFEAGDEFTQKAADGTVCASLKAPDTLKRVTLSVAICDPDPEFTEIIAGGRLLTDELSDKTVGWSAPSIGVDATPNGCAIEVWSKAVSNGKTAGVNPYFHWIFPYAQMRISGDRVIENGMMGTSFEGWAVGNPAFGESVKTMSVGKPAAPFAFTTPDAVSYARTDTAASVPGGAGYVPVGVAG